MTESKICTCPSGDGSLRWPCPKHPAVEQAGGDEREAAIAKFAETCPMTAESAAGGKSYDIELRRYYLLGWDDRAALAQPSPAPHPAPELDFSRPLETENGEPVKWIGADVIEYKSARVCVAKDTGLVYSSPYIGLKICNVMPEQAEAERQEVVDFNPYRYHAEKIRQRADGAASAYEAGRSALGYMEDIAESALIVRNGLDELSAQHERITAKLHDALDESDGDRWKMRSERDAANARLHEVATACATAEQERDAALAEVERLRESKGDPSGSFDRCMKMMYERDENAKRLDAALAKVAELDKQCRDDVARALGLRPSQERGFAWSYLLASIKSCVKASEDAAQAQHSVPEGWMLVECGIWTQEQVDEMQKTVARFRNSEFVDDRALAMAVADAGQCKAPEISLAELLAAAPGKEVGHE